MPLFFAHKGMKNEVRKVLITYQSADPSPALLVDLISIFFSGTLAFKWDSNSYFTGQFDDVTLVFYCIQK